MAKFWAAREREAPTPKAYAKSVAKQWRKIGCAAERARYVLRRLIDRLDDESTFEQDSPEKQKLAADFLAKDCLGAHGLSGDEIATLKEIAAPPAPQSPKP
jgi:hypothetical protein